MLTELIVLNCRQVICLDVKVDCYRERRGVRSKETEIKLKLNLIANSIQRLREVIWYKDSGQKLYLYTHNLSQKLIRIFALRKKCLFISDAENSAVNCVKTQ